MAQVPSAVAHAAGAFGLDAGSLRVLSGISGSAWGAGDRVLRVGRPAVIDAELAASSAAAAVLPVPAVLDRVEVGDVSAVLLEMLPGRPAADFARGSPGLARVACQACGAVHALLADVRAPAGLRTVPGPGVPTPAGQARVVHLDPAARARRSEPGPRCSTDGPSPPPCTMSPPPTAPGPANSPSAGHEARGRAAGGT
jgi:hypothetical protein